LLFPGNRRWRQAKSGTGGGRQGKAIENANDAKDANKGKRNGGGYGVRSPQAAACAADIAARCPYHPKLPTDYKR